MGFADVPVLAFLEAPVGREAFRNRYEKFFGPPIGIDAAIFGWTQRARLFYGGGPRGAVGNLSSIKLPAMMVAKDRTMGDDRCTVASVAWKGPTLPGTVRVESGFEFTFSAKNVVASDGAGALPTFVRDFPHKGLNPRGSATDGASARAAADGNAFPLTNYARKALLWRGDEWRTASAQTRAQIHMQPWAMVEKLKSKTGARERQSG